MSVVQIATVSDQESLSSSASVISIIPFKELEPSWHVSSAKVPGFMRWLINWVGGPPGYINSCPSRAIQSQNMALGYMYLPVGQRQEGFHYHTVTEIYVILRGSVQSYEADGTSTIAGPLDCIYIPSGVPHGVRNCGLEDVELIWLHDTIEAKGLTVYCNTPAELLAAPSSKPIQVIRFLDLEPSWAAAGAKIPEYMRWSINWVGGGEAMLNFNPDQSAISERVVMGMTCIMPGNKHLSHRHTRTEVYVVLHGKGVIRIGKTLHEVTYLDAVHVPAGEYHSLRNHGMEPLHVLWVLDEAESIGAATYQDPTE